jgi:hypothetical protein
MAIFDHKFTEWVTHAPHDRLPWVTVPQRRCYMLGKDHSFEVTITKCCSNGLRPPSMFRRCDADTKETRQKMINHSSTWQSNTQLRFDEFYWGESVKEKIYPKISHGFCGLNSQGVHEK